MARDKRGNVRRLRPSQNVLSYVGVDPSTPTDVFRFDRYPLPTDYWGFTIGDVWIVDQQTDDPTSNVSYDECRLVNLQNSYAKWWCVRRDAASGFAALQADDGNTAAPNGSGYIIVGGDGSILTTTADNVNTETIGFTSNTDGQIIIGNTASGPQWGELTSPDGSITINYNDPNIELTANAMAGVNSVSAGTNINLTGTAADPIVNLDSSIQQPATNVTGTTGVYALGATVGPDYIADRFLHAYGTRNTFVGAQAGTIAAGTTGTDNSGGGRHSLNALTSGNNNSAWGADSLSNLTSGSNNLALGVNSGSNYTTESNNLTIANTGTVADSGQIRIGTNGTHTQAYMQGIWHNSPSSPEYVIINSDGKLGTTTSSTGAVKTTIYTSNDTWIKDSNAQWIKVFVWHGGGGGGSGGKGNSSYESISGGGGGAGGCMKYENPAFTFPATGSVVIGAGGIGGAALSGASNSIGNIGYTGGLSYFCNYESPTNVPSKSNDIPIMAGQGAGDKSKGGNYSGSVLSFVGDPWASSARGGYIENFAISPALGTDFSDSGGGVSTPTTGNAAVDKGIQDWRSTSGGGGGYTIQNTSGGAGSYAAAGRSGAFYYYKDFAGFGSYTQVEIIPGAKGGINNGTQAAEDGIDYTANTLQYFIGATGGGGGFGESRNTLYVCMAEKGGDGGLPGGGGGGGGSAVGTSYNNNPSGAGGDGGSGLIIVYEYL